MKYLRRLLSLRSRLNIIFLAVFAIPAAVLGAYYSASVVRMSGEQVLIKSEASANQLELNLQNELERLANSIIATISDADFINFFIQSHSTAGEYFANYNLIRNKLSFLSATTFDGMNIHFSTANPTVIQNSVSIFTYSADSLPDWYHSALENGRELIFSVENENLTVRKAINYSQPDVKKTAVLTLTVPAAVISDYFTNEAPGTNVYLIGPDGLIISSNLEDSVGGVFHAPSADVGQPLIFYKDIFSGAPYGDWMLCYDASAQALRSDFPSIMGAGFIVLLICLATVIASVVYTSNFVSARIGRLTAEVFEKELESKEARMQALQSQIEPHFLFNTLQTVQMILIKNNDTQAADVVNSLALLMRGRIYWSDGTVPLKDEINMVRHYLNIQSCRYRDKLDYIFDINPEFDSVPILQFTLQPVVENAVRHGIEIMDAKGTVIVSCESADGGYIDISVRDNGMGIEADRLQEILESVNRPEMVRRKNIGLTNVHQRLKLHFGEGCGITRIESTPGGGTTVVLRVLYADTARGNENV